MKITIEMIEVGDILCSADSKYLVLQVQQSSTVNLRRLDNGETFNDVGIYHFSNIIKGKITNWRKEIEK